jgi:hypothetical protein
MAKVKKASPVKYLIGRTEGPEENTGPGFFAVKLTPELGKLVAKRYLLWRAAHEQDKRLYELWFWDDHARWLDDTFDSDEHLPEELADRIDDEGDMVTLPAEEVEEYAEGNAYQARTECWQMTVDDHSVKWTCYPKHGGGEYSTDKLPLDGFLAALAESELPRDPAVKGFLAKGAERGGNRSDDYAIFLGYLKEKGVLS